MRKILFLLLLPCTLCGAEYSASLTAIENLLSNINRALQSNDTDDVLSYLDDIDHFWANFAEDFPTLMDDVSSVATSSQHVENYLLQVSGRLLDVYTRLGYINSTCTSILTNLNQSLTYFDSINGSVTRIARDIGVYGDAILTAFSTLQTTVSSIDANVDSIDATTRELLQAVIALSVVTNQSNGVVYDFSVLTNSFGSSGSVTTSVRGLMWSDYTTLDLLLNTAPNATFRDSQTPFKANLSTYLRQIFYEHYYSNYALRNIGKSAIISALSDVSISNNVGRLVVQGDLLTNRVDTISKNTFWISNYLDSVLAVTQKQLTNDTGRMVAILEQLTNQHFSVSAELKKDIQDGVDYSTETADSIEEPDRLNVPNLTGMTFDLSNVKAFVDSIPTYDVLPMYIYVSYTDTAGTPVEWAAETAPYGAVCSAIRAVSSVLIYGVVLTLTIVGVKWIFRILIFIAGLIPSVDKV